MQPFSDTITTSGMREKSGKRPPNASKAGNRNVNNLEVD